MPIKQSDLDKIGVMPSVSSSAGPSVVTQTDTSLFVNDTKAALQAKDSGNRLITEEYQVEQE